MQMISHTISSIFFFHEELWDVICLHCTFAVYICYWWFKVGPIRQHCLSIRQWSNRTYYSYCYYFLKHWVSEAHIHYSFLRSFYSSEWLSASAPMWTKGPRIKDHQLTMSGLGITFPKNLFKFYSYELIKNGEINNDWRNGRSITA